MATITVNGRTFQVSDDKTIYPEDVVNKQSRQWQRQYYDYLTGEKDGYWSLAGSTLSPNNDDMYSGGNLAEVSVTAKKPTMTNYLAENAKKNWANEKEQVWQVVKTGLSFVPYVGDALDVYDAYNNAKQGNYGAALAGIGLLAVPNVLEKPLKAGFRFLKETPLLLKYPKMFKYRTYRGFNGFFKSGEKELLRDIRAGLASEIEPDKEIKKLYRHYADNPDLIRKWSDLADGLNLQGSDRRKYIIDNVIKAHNRSSRVIPSETPLSDIDNYLFTVRNDKAFGNRNLSIPMNDNEEVLHYADALYTSRYISPNDKNEFAIRGIIDRTNDLQLDGTIKSVHKDINNASLNIPGFKVVTTTRVPGSPYVPKELNISEKLPENLMKRIRVNHNPSVYNPMLNINALVAPFNTSLERISKTVDRSLRPKDANWWEIAGFYKSGGPIKIKKKNRGKFTDYCGGKVTEECIRKGKNSSNPTTRKRANFAWVARHKFKHEEGGTINYLNMFNENN